MEEREDRPVVVVPAEPGPVVAPEAADRRRGPEVRSLLALHARLVEGVPAGGPVPPVAAVAHDAVREVATLLDGGAALGPDERSYVHDRVSALADLAAAIDEAGAPSRDPERRRALLEARQEVDRLAGTATPALVHELADEIRRHGR